MKVNQFKRTFWVEKNLRLLLNSNENKLDVSLSLCGDCICIELSKSRNVKLVFFVGALTCTYICEAA